MSENAITLVEVGIAAPAAMARALEVRTWLLTEGIVVPNAQRDDRFQPSEFMAGPNVHDATPDAAQFLPSGPGEPRLINSGVDVATEREVHHPIENYEPPPCPTCGTRLDEAAHYALLDEWLAGPEPFVTCETCGQATRIGDWVDVFTFYVGNLAVRFNNWSPLSDGFVERLSTQMGDRTRIVYEHS